METEREPYPSDVSDEEWAFVAPYLSLMPLDAAQRTHDLREVFNALRYVMRGGIPWRMLLNDLPTWYTVYQQAQRWLAAGSFEARTLQSTPESGARAGYDGYKRKKGSKVHMAVDTLGNLLAMHATPANEQERAQVKKLAEAVQEVTHKHVKLAYVDQGYTGEEPAKVAEEQGITLEVVKLAEAKRGFVLLP